MDRSLIQNSQQQPTTGMESDSNKFKIGTEKNKIMNGYMNLKLIMTYLGITGILS